MKENTIALALLSALLATPAVAQTGDAKAELARLKPNEVVISGRITAITPLNRCSTM